MCLSATACTFDKKPLIIVVYAISQVEAVVNPIPPKIFTSAKLERDGCTGETLLVVYRTVCYSCCLNILTETEHSGNSSDFQTLDMYLGRWQSNTIQCSRGAQDRNSYIVRHQAARYAMEWLQYTISQTRQSH